ncbi:aminoglycoside 6-adenylyltransferase [Mycoplasmatota bacterium]|nr:aminoglycoside 6-adenylyltransferase [Mycoplasmatota bacterium]
MRSEKEMFDLILGIAKDDERIRAVYMNGSRTNPNIPKDIFQDYDIVYVVKETSSFLKDEKWINVFGELLMIQEPDKLDQICGMEMDFDRSYGYLMLFKDGNRIDLHIETKESMLEGYTNDSLTIPLLDKDNCLPKIPKATDVDYWVNKPTEPQFMRNCNNFWWCMQNVAKGIWREELPYVKKMYECVVREMLDEMVSWWVGINHDYKVSTGKMGKYFKKYLPKSYWDLYQGTYSDSNYDNIWDSVFKACDLFRSLSKDVSNYFTFTYPTNDDKNMTQYLTHVRNLLKNAKGIY